jgi:hypothetical protein
MKRFIIRIIATLITFLIGIAAASAWLPQLQPAVNDVKPSPIQQRVVEIPAHKPKDLAAIEILRYDPELPITETKIENLAAKETDIELDLGESIENQIIALNTYPNDLREFKVEQQFETSMTVMDEGPHMDMVDWKHFTSDWREIQRMEGNRFLTSQISEADNLRFPKVTSKEIYQAVLKGGDRKWAEHARSCKNANDYPCGVTTSRISLRIMAKEDGRWNVIHRINFKIPMGC